MFFARKSLVAPALVVAVALVLLAGAPAAGQGQGAAKLEGTWVARVVEFDGAPSPWPFQWSYVLTPDNSGRTAAIYGNVDIGFPPTPPLLADAHSPLLGRVVTTGPRTTAFDSYWYGIKKDVLPGLDAVLYIGRAWGEGRVVAAGKTETTHHFEVYLPAADADGDGLPDPGAVPVKTFTVVTHDTRVPPLPMK